MEQEAKDGDGEGKDGDEQSKDGDGLLVAPRRTGFFSRFSWSKEAGGQEKGAEEKDKAEAEEGRQNFLLTVLKPSVTPL